MRPPPRAGRPRSAAAAWSRPASRARRSRALRALEDGGNACDAALAAAGVLAVTEPNQCGARRRPVRDRRPRRRAAGRAERQRAGAGRARRCAARAVRAAQRDRARVRRRLDATWRSGSRGAGWRPRWRRAIALARDGFGSSRQGERELAGGRLADLAGDATPPFGRPRRFARRPSRPRSSTPPPGRSTPGRSPTRSRRSRGSTRPTSRRTENDWVEPLEFAYRDRTLLELPPNGQGSIAGWALEELGVARSARPGRGARRRLRARLRDDRRHRVRLRRRRRRDGASR